MLLDLLENHDGKGLLSSVSKVPLTNCCANGFPTFPTKWHCFFPVFVVAVPLTNINICKQSRKLHWDRPECLSLVERTLQAWPHAGPSPEAPPPWKGGQLSFPFLFSFECSLGAGAER